MLPRIALLALCATSLAVPTPSDAQDPRTPGRTGEAPDRLSRSIRARVATVSGARVGVYFRDLGSGATVALNADTLFHAASTMKVPVMLEYFRGVDRRRFAPDARVRLANRFSSIVDGSPYMLDAADDSDSALYREVGKEVPLRELVDRMITRSSNLATNAVIEVVGARAAQASAESLGARTIAVRRGVEDNLAYRAGLNNMTSARDLGVLLEAIAGGAAASPASTQAMLEMLGRQEFNDEIPAGLPPGTPVAHKTGWINGILHDAALVRPAVGAPFVLVVLTANVPDRAAARALIQDVARLVWQEARGR